MHYLDASDDQLETAMSESETNQSSFSLPRLVITVVVTIAVMVGVYFIVMPQPTIEGAASPDTADRMMSAMGFGKPVTNRLGSAYVDQDGDLVADTPSDAALLLDPDVLTFSFIANELADEDAQRWQAMVDALAQATGKRVEYTAFTDRDAKLTAIRDGELHVAVLNTGSVPVAVNACGFVPVGAPGQGGQVQGYNMVIITPAGGDIDSLEDLSGELFAFTQPTSNSGCKAAVVTLFEAAGLKLGADYEAAFTYGHAKLIRAIAEKQYVAGSTASDLLDQAIASGDIEQGAVEVIYESETFPTAAIGMSHRLNPGLASKIREALLAFRFEGTPLAEVYSASGADAFAPVSYKDDFALIRRIDDAVGFEHQRLLESAPEE